MTKSLYSVLTALCLSLFTQTIYAACSIEQKLNLSTQEINKNCSDANDINNNARINSDASPKKDSGTFQHNRFFIPAAEKFFMSAGVRITTMAPEKHEQTRDYFVSPNFSIFYFPNSITANSLGIGLTLFNLHGGVVTETAQMNTRSGQLFYVLKQGHLFSTIPFIGAGYGDYSERFTSSVTGNYKVISAGIKVVSGRVYIAGSGFFAKIDYNIYSNIDIDNSPKEYRIPNSLDLSLAYIW